MIPGLPSLGGAELLILLAIVVLFFGAKRLPEMGRSLGRGITEFKEALNTKREPEKNEEEHPPEAIEEKEHARTRG
jgi:sec-independent protein translocase protein TatA